MKRKRTYRAIIVMTLAVWPPCRRRLGGGDLVREEMTADSAAVIESMARPPLWKTEQRQ